MSKLKKYIKENPEYEMYLVDKRFGNGKQLIKFFYNGQINGFKQGFLAYVDTKKWRRDQHEVMDEVQDYLIEKIGVIDDNDFIEDYNEGNQTEITMSDIYNNEELLSKYNEWYKEEFPKICLFGGGVCHFSAV